MQTGPECFRVLAGDGRMVEVTLAHHTRRGLGLVGVPPLAVVAEIVAFLTERGEPLTGRTDGQPLSLGAAAGRYPELIEELRARLT